MRLGSSILLSYGNTSFFSASYFYYRLLTNNTIDPVTNIGQPPGAGFLISPPLSTTNTSFGNVVVLDDLDCLFLPFVASVTSIAAGCLVSGLGAGVTPLLSYPSLPDTGLSYYASEFNGSSTGPCANVEVDDNLYVAYCLSFPTWGIWGFRTSKATPAGPWVDFQVLDSADSSPLVARTFDAVLHLVNGALQVFFDAEDDTTGLLGRYLLGAAGPPNPPVITCGNPPQGIIGTAYTHTLPVAGGTAPFMFTLTAGMLPPGLTLNVATGVISGTPTTGGTYPFTVQVTDSIPLSSSVSCSILVGGQPVRITLRGVKVRRSECPPELENVLEAPHVEKAI